MPYAQPTGENIFKMLGIAEERMIKVMQYCATKIEEILEMPQEVRSEDKIIKQLTEDVIKNEFTTLEVVVMCYKLGGVLEMYYPNPVGKLLRFARAMGQAGGED